MGFIIFLSALATVALIIFVIAWMVNWYEDTWFDKPKIKYKSFIKFYHLNPTRWALDSGQVECRTDSIGWSRRGMTFRFGPVDYLRYKHFYATKEKRERQAEQAKLIARMLNAVKEDIAATEELAKREQEEALKTLKEKLHVTL